MPPETLAKADLTPVSHYTPREVTPIQVRELRDLRLKEAVLDEVDKRFKPFDERLDRMESKQDRFEAKQDAHFNTILEHVTRKSVMETLAANTKAVVITTLILLVLAVSVTQTDFGASIMGLDVEVHPTLLP